MPLCAACYGPMERILAGLGSFRFVDHPHRTIRFTSTEDGVDIAFWEIGEGKPVVIIQNFSLVMRNWSGRFLRSPRSTRIWLSGIG